MKNEQKEEPLQEGSVSCQRATLRATKSMTWQQLRGSPVPEAPSSPGSGKLHLADGPRMALAAASYARAASSAVSNVPSHLCTTQQPQTTHGPGDCRFTSIPGSSCGLSMVQYPKRLTQQGHMTNKHPRVLSESALALTYYTELHTCEH
jgi:hypothetical protein